MLSSRLVALLRLKNPVYYLSIAEVKADGYMPFSRALVQSKMQTALSMIWTLAADSISYNNKHYNNC